jgi:hypothetical protein
MINKNSYRTNTWFLWFDWVSRESTVKIIQNLWKSMFSIEAEKWGSLGLGFKMQLWSTSLRLSSKWGTADEGLAIDDCNYIPVTSFQFCIFKYTSHTIMWSLMSRGLIYDYKQQTKFQIKFYFNIISSLCRLISFTKLFIRFNWILWKYKEVLLY